MIFYFAIPVGSGLGYVVGSSFADLMGSWQWGIRVTPFIGLFCVMTLILFVDEPERGQAENVPLHSKASSPPNANPSRTRSPPSSHLIDDLKYLIRKWVPIFLDYDA